MTTAPELPGYRMLTGIAEGGGGHLFIGARRGSGERVAIKVLHPAATGSTEDVSRSLRNARTLIGVDSANLVRVLDCGEAAGGRAYIVMELLSGQDLGELLATNKALDCRRVVAIAKQVCNGLHALHRASLVHLDIKPNNIFLIDDGDQPERVKLLDFGAARPAAAGQVSLPSPETMRPVELLGTPEYWSPERACGTDVGPQADIYSLGVVMYEMLTGRPPFKSHSYTDIVSMHLRARPAMLVQPDSTLPIPDQLKGIVLHCLRKEPGERFESAAALAEAIARVELPPEVVLPTVPISPAPKRSARRLLVAAVVAGVAAMAAAIYALAPTTEAANPASTQVVTDSTAVPNDDAQPAGQREK